MCAGNVCVYVCEYIYVVSLSYIEKIRQRLTKLAFLHAYALCVWNYVAISAAFFRPTKRKIFLECSFPAATTTPSFSLISHNTYRLTRL